MENPKQNPLQYPKQDSKQDSKQHPLQPPSANSSKPRNADTLSPFIKFSLEMGPLLIFFLINFRGQWLLDNISLFSSFDKPIYPATAFFMIATAISMIVSWVLVRTIPIMPLVSGIFVLIFGLLTLWLHDDLFIKMKPTLINILFSAILFGGLYYNKSLLSHVLDKSFQLTETGWRILTLRWAWFFLFLAVLNEIVWRNFSDQFWSSFKLFGTMPITIIFMLLQIQLLMRHAISPSHSPHSSDIATKNHNKSQ